MVIYSRAAEFHEIWYGPEGVADSSIEARTSVFIPSRARRLDTPDLQNAIRNSPTRMADRGGPADGASGKARTVRNAPKASVPSRARDKNSLPREKPGLEHPNIANIPNV
jgi:hypothetical protein